MIFIAEARKNGSAKNKPMPLVEEELSERILGCCIWVHRALGPGFLEKVYEEAVSIELTKAGLGFERQKTVVIFYDQKPVGEHRLDLLVESRVVIELKAGLAGQRAVAQLLSYMGDVSAEEEGRKIRGILVASDFDRKAKAAARMVPNLALRRYSIQFRFSDA